MREGGHNRLLHRVRHRLTADSFCLFTGVVLGNGNRDKVQCEGLNEDRPLSPCKFSIHDTSLGAPAMRRPLASLSTNPLLTAT